MSLGTLDVYEATAPARLGQPKGKGRDARGSGTPQWHPGCTPPQHRQHALAGNSPQFIHFGLKNWAVAT